ncbi:MAG TPA: PIG-L family deacetylase [Gemmatimonadaceae bacterium]
MLKAVSLASTPSLNTCRPAARWVRGVTILLALVLAPGMASGQELVGANALAEALEGLGVSTRVLMIGAHPDDEDTQVIAWLSRGRHVETAYLSLTRGDGGQNIIGNELGEALGVVRTEELLAARRVDGGRQYFTRAYDFGFSKSAEEAFTQWSRDSLLRDVVTVVRAFRPHVIISVFTGTPRDGHGQHQVAGILAREAYDVSGDTVRFPRAATNGYGPWTVTKFYRGASFRPEAATLRFNVGEYDPVLGRSYAEIAAISRSQHRSQAFGTLQRRGVRWDQVQLEASRVSAADRGTAEQSLFDRIDTTWARFRSVVQDPGARAALDSLPAAFAAAKASFDAFAPEKSIPALARVQSLLLRLCSSTETQVGATACNLPRSAPAQGTTNRETDLSITREIALDRANRALVLATGVALEATAAREVWALDEAVPVSLTLYNRGRLPVQVTGYSTPRRRTELTSSRGALELLPDSAVNWQDTARVATPSATPTQPYWLVRPRNGSMYESPTTGVDERAVAVEALASVNVQVNETHFTIVQPITYRYVDQVRGEINRPIADAPAVSVLLDHELQYAPANTPIERAIRVHLRSASSDTQRVSVALRLPAGLQADSASRSVTLPGPGAQRTVTFTVRGQLPVGRHAIDAVATSGGRTFQQGYILVDYEHINPRRIYRPSRLTIESVDLEVPENLRVGYIQGVGDNSAPMLEQLGIDVTLIDPATIASVDLSPFTAVVVGPRAYEASPALAASNARLLEYVRNGGTAVVQYGQYEMMLPGMTPFPITINRPHDRVTVENAPVRIVEPDARVLTTPNRITEQDFEGWVQDRSLYMPRTFDERYQAPLEMNDPGSPPIRGALLVAPYGRGTYVYTAIAFFRQLPNGVPGAARLFVNLLAAGQSTTPR